MKEGILPNGDAGKTIGASKMARDRHVMQIKQAEEKVRNKLF